jgi:hypothetical protein
MSSRSLATCFHEAGHAVVAAHLGVRFFEAVVRRSVNYARSGERLGRISGSVSFHWAAIAHLSLGYEDWRDHVRQLLAGDIAKEMYYRQTLRRKFDDYGGTTDRKNVAKLMTHFRAQHPTFTLEQARGEATALVVELYPKIELVAVALKAKGKLTEDEVVSICGMGERRDPVFEPEPTDA